MTNPAFRVIMQVDHLLGSVEQLMQQQMDDQNSYAEGYRTGRQEIGHYVTNALLEVRRELMSQHLEYSQSK